MASSGTETSISECWTGRGSECTAAPLMASISPHQELGTTNELLLASWLLVLLRTSRDTQLLFEWSNTGSHQTSVTTTFSEEQQLLNRQSSIRQLIQAVSTHIKTSQTPAGDSILLSTGSLLQDSKTGNLVHLETNIRHNSLSVRQVWHSDNVLPYTIRRFVETLVDTVKICIASPDASIADCIGPSHHDLDMIWKWNHQLPPSHHFGMHAMISERAHQYPEKVAIDSWDGELTYRDVDTYSSFLAAYLQKLQSPIPQFIPVCFEKSKWTVVAVLAVMKAGAAMVLMDPTLPLARLQNMKEQVNATLMLSSRSQRDISSSIIADGKVVVVDKEAMTQLSSSCSEAPKLPPVSPSSLMYIVFTSGSTGIPKGVMISHRSYTSSAIPRAAAVGYCENLRVLDFASYAFDVSIDSMLLTLGSGGCLCIPSDEDRINDINGAMRRMRVSYAGITPSMARLLEPDVITGLSALGLGGEPASARDVNHWGRETRIVIGYGPCECTIGCTINGDVATGRDYISIGPGNGAAMWIVDPNDHEMLMPVGAVGELLVEGPIVGQGYLNDPEKTAAAFIHDPKWLISGHGGYHGRRGRLYKTGDLGIYDPDGSGGIVFVGRKDTQVKLRGQRVELGEIESQLGTSLQSGISVVAEVIKPTSSGSQPTLVAFIAPSNATASGGIQVAQPDEQLNKALSEANSALAKVLPRFMVPTAYITVNHIPLLISGKVDRKKLREFGIGVDLRQQLEHGDVDDSQQFNEREEKLRQAWVTTLNKHAEEIGHKSDFFALGGDSLAAMKLVSVCRSLGLTISVGDIFASRTLGEMASTAVGCSLGPAPQEIEPFSMITQALYSAKRDASRICSTNTTSIQDMFPCTPTQESLFTFSMKSEIPYVAQRIAKIPSHVNIQNWKKAWEAVVAANPILRTRVVQLDDQGFQQVIIDEGINWVSSTNLNEYVDTDKRNSMDFGQPLARYAIVDDQDEKYMVWTIHHVVYDGFSEPLLLEKVYSALCGKTVGTVTEMKHFSKYIQSIEADELQGFWKDELCDAIGPQFPTLPSRDYFPTPDGCAHRVVSLALGNKSCFTLATLIRGAWALVASQHIGSEDVVFGETLAGRDIALPGVEEICGPLVATVPVRIRIDHNQPVSTFLEHVQRTMLNLAPYQHAGMQNIRKVSDDAQFACETGTGIVIQPAAGGNFEKLGFPRADPVREALHFNPYPLMVAFGLGHDEIRISASFDTSLIQPAKMDRILAQFETVLVQLSQHTYLKLNQISHVSADDLDQVWSWNQIPPMGTLGGPANVDVGSKHPPAVISWVCNAHNSSLLSPIGCPGELCLEGNLLVGDTVRSPSWLLAGSPNHPGREGNVQLTGAIVELQSDGSIIYLGRKEDMLSTDGQASSFKQLQGHITRQLSPSFSAAVVAAPSRSGENDASSRSGGMVFVEQPPSSEESVELIWMGHTIVSDSPDAFELQICPNMTTSLGLALQKLEKSIKNAFPSRVSALTYIPVAKLPHSSHKQDEHDLLSQMASKIPSHLLDQISVAMREWWANGSSGESLTPAESILQQAWASILRRDAKSIDVHDNFFRLGGDSVLAMKLVALLRSQGHRLTVADIFKNMRLDDAAKVLKTESAVPENGQPYKAFSLLDVPDTEQFLVSIVEPKIRGQHTSILDVLPVTESQALDVRATVDPPRTSIQYTMLYFDQDVNKMTLMEACNDLVSSHEILRSVFIEQESRLLQVILAKLDDGVEVRSCSDEDLDVYVERLCAEDIESKFELGSSFFKMFHVEGKAGNSCLIIRLSHAQYDGVSLPALLRSLEASYSGKKQEQYQPFSRYITQSFGPASDRAIEYWSKLLSGSSLSILKETSKQVGQRAVFKHQQAVVTNLPKEVTTASFLAATWAVVLARRLGRQDVTFGGITSGRGAEFSDVDSVVGPCYQFTPIRVQFEKQWTASDLMQHLQRQNAESAAHDFVGYGKIATTCTGDDKSWKEGFFDSVVHHQDWDKTDHMPFGVGSCRTAISSPHGDAPYPLKVVSFVKDDGLHLGIVGNEGDRDVVEELLSELVTTAEELARDEDLRIAPSSQWEKGGMVK